MRQPEKSLRSLATNIFPSRLKYLPVGTLLNLWKHFSGWTTWLRVGFAVTKLFSLPTVSEISLQDFKARTFISVRSIFHREMLDVVQRITGTTDSDWELTNGPVEPIVEKAYEGFRNGGFRPLICGGNLIQNEGNDYILTKETFNRAVINICERDMKNTNSSSNRVK